MAIKYENAQPRVDKPFRASQSLRLGKLSATEARVQCRSDPLSVWRRLKWLIIRRFETTQFALSKRHWLSVTRALFFGSRKEADQASM
jgi:hypothetical protein